MKPRPPRGTCRTTLDDIEPAGVRRKPPDQPPVRTIRR